MVNYHQLDICQLFQEVVANVHVQGPTMELGLHISTNIDFHKVHSSIPPGCKRSSIMFIMASIVLASLAQVNFAALTSSQKSEILPAHNHFRGKVDPISTNMHKLVNYQAHS